MKILEHGLKYDDGKPFIGKCNSCRCKVAVGRSEIKYQVDQREGDYYYVECPECHGSIYFTDVRLGNKKENWPGLTF